MPDDTTPAPVRVLRRRDALGLAAALGAALCLGSAAATAKTTGQP